MREQVYADPRPKEHFDRFHERSRTREPDWAYDLTRVLTSLYAYTFLRARAISPEKVPGAGAVILAPNHFSFMDHFLMGCYIRRKVRFMAKSQLFKPGPMQYIYTHGGVFPVRRGARDDGRKRRGIGRRIDQRCEQCLEIAHDRSSMEYSSPRVTARCWRASCSARATVPDEMCSASAMSRSRKPAK